MTIKKLICRMDGTQELAVCELPDDWAAEPVSEETKTAQNSTAADKPSAAE